MDLQHRPFDRWSSTVGLEVKHQGSVTFRKEVIQPQVLLQLPCYDFTPIANHTMDSCLPKVSPPASGAIDFRDVTGGVYKARERIHPSMLIWDY